MKKSTADFVAVILLILSFGACSPPTPVLRITPKISEYSSYMSSTPGIPLTAVSTLDLTNKNVQYHWLAEAGTLLKWDDGNGYGRVEILGSDVRTNLPKVYWSMDELNDIPATAFQVHLTIEALDTGKIIAKASLTIRQPSPDGFTIQD